MPRVLGGSYGGPRGVGVFLRVRYPCMVVLAKGAVSCEPGFPVGRDPCAS